jgi:hypothetical protein
MTRTVMMVLGILLALFVVFTWIIPTVFALLKFALIIGIIAVVVFVAINVISKSSSR